jgi:uncharacterized protein YeaO (DUF488 family)
MHLQIRRVYEDPDPQDGLRILVDRLWPRGIAKERLSHDKWLREIAPSTELRKWYGHQPARFEEFRRRYLQELQTEPKAGLVRDVQRAAEHQPITLLTATKDVDHSAAAVLAEILGTLTRPARPADLGSLR